MKYDVFISYNSSDKQIADAVCHYLEERRLRCFIAPRDIMPPDWAGSITAAIEQSRAFVVVVSENSIVSNEVAKEITLATRVSNYIFPFRVDESELDGRMTYHLSAFHWIDAVNPPLERRLIELADRVTASLDARNDNVELEALAGSRNRLACRLLGQAVGPRSEFTGRGRELEEIHHLFENGCHSVFLCGMGGIGKSEIAKAYAKAHAKEYKTVLFASYETDLLHLIASDQSVPIENLKQASASGGQGETLQAYYDRKMKVLKSLVDEGTLIIIDNFDTEEDEKLAELLDLRCRILWTTRTDFSAYGYETVKIGPMEHFEDLVELFGRIDRIYSLPEEQKAVEEIIRLLDCHTYAVSLTAAQMRAGRIKPKKMLEQLRDQGLKIQTRGTFSREAGSKKATAYEYIQALFDFSRLDDTACGILRNLACVPREGIDIDLFMECAKIDDFGDISRLIDLNWVQIDEENDRIGLHMLIKEMVFDRMTPSIASSRPFLEGVNDRVWNAWNQSFEENCRMESLVYSLMEVFDTPTPKVLDIFENYATFAWIQGNFELADDYEHKLYELCEKTYTQESREAGNQALRVAAVYHNMGDYERARPWYEQGYRALQAVCGDTHETCTACMKVGRSDAQNGDYKSAEEKYRYSLEVLTRLLGTVDPSDAKEARAVKVKRGFALMDLAHIYTCEGRCEEALPLALESYEELKDDTVAPAMIIYAMMVLAYVYYGLKDYDKAADYVERSLEENLHYRGEISIDMMFLHEMQGDIHTMQQRYEAAAGEYSKALGGREKYFASDVSALARLERKYECAKNGSSAGLPFLDIWP